MLEQLFSTSMEFIALFDLHFLQHTLQRLSIMLGGVTNTKCIFMRRVENFINIEILHLKVVT
jgi:hypothetical protein